MESKHLNTEKVSAANHKIVDKGRQAIEKKSQALDRLKIEYVPVGSVKPNSYNPNRQDAHEFELLTKSMREDGFTQPIVTIEVSESIRQDKAFKDYAVGDIVIVDGEHRWRAAQHLGFAEVPIVKTNMTPEQMRIATLRHNRARGAEDVALSAAVLKDLRELNALEWAQDSLMLDDVEMEKLLEDVPAPEALAGDSFNEAWTPDKGAETQVVISNHAQQADATPAALAKMREKEAAIVAAKTEEERSAIKRDSDIYRVAAMFSGEEAKVVKAVLGASPAMKILEMCQKEHAAAQD